MGAPYENWLNLCVDHVVPGHLVKAGWPREWVLDRINLVTCCRACNEFLNGYRLADLAVPMTFADLHRRRDMLSKKKHGSGRATVELVRTWRTIGQSTETCGAVVRVPVQRLRTSSVEPE